MELRLKKQGLKVGVSRRRDISAGWANSAKSQGRDGVIWIILGIFVTVFPGDQRATWLDQGTELTAGSIFPGRSLR
jgi:hypothetical protein